MSLVARVTALAQAIAADIKSLTSGKVDKVSGKGLSTEDYSTGEKNKLSGIQVGAQVNAVSSVAGRTGAVTLTKSDVGLANADNTADSAKPVSVAQQAALDLKVNTSSVQTTQNDRTNNALMRVGAFGLGKQLDFRPLSISGATPPSAFFDTGTMYGFVAGGTGDATQPGMEIPELLGSRNYGVLLVHGHWRDATGGGAVHQVFSTGARVFTRLPTGAETWGSWREQAYMDAVNLKAPINSPQFTGNIGIGVAAQANRKIRLGGTYDGTSEFRSIEFAESIDPSKAPSYQAITAGITLLDTVGTITANLFRTYPPGFNGNSAVITELNNFYCGPVANANVTASYAFRGLMAVVASKERYNLFCDGNAPNYLNGELRVGANTSNGVDKMTVAGSVSMSGPVKVGQYTLSTLPSAAAWSGYEIDVTNATVAPAGPKRCRSNGTNWLILNTNTPVS